MSGMWWLFIVAAVVLLGIAIYNGLIKAAFFGAAFTLISCYKGFYTKGGAEGVGRATTGAVVYSSMAILISDYFLSAWLF